MKLIVRALLRLSPIIITAGFCAGFTCWRLTSKDTLQVQAGTRPDTEQRISAILKRMTLEEKVRMCFGGEQPGVVQLPGVPRLGIPPMMGTDGPRGVASAASATAFPAGIALASSWNPELLHRVGIAMGQETRASGRSIIFAPAINIDRGPARGAVFRVLHRGSVP